MLPLSIRAKMRQTSAAVQAGFEKMQWRKLAREFSFIAAPALGLSGIVFFALFESGPWHAAPGAVRFAALTLLFLLFATLLLLYALFITMIMTWDIDRISYAVEEEAQRQLLKRISAEKQKQPGAVDESEPDNRAAGSVPAKLSAALENMIERRANFLWQQLLQSGCIDFPRADVKRAIKTIREEQPAENSGIFDALKAMVVSKLFARSYVPRLRLKIMDKLVFKFVWEIAHLFVSVIIVFLATVLLWSAAVPGIFSTPPDGISVCVFVADLTLRGAIFTLVDHLGLRLTHLAPAPHAVLFIAHTLAYRLFLSLYVIATFIKVLKLMLRRKYMAA
jgi:hypothetical protein